MPVRVVADPDHPLAAYAAAATVAAMLRAVAPTPVEFDGQTDDPVYLRILQAIPQRRTGTLTPVDLVRIKPSEVRARS